MGDARHRGGVVVDLLGFDSHAVFHINQPRVVADILVVDDPGQGDGAGLIGANFEVPVGVPTGTSGSPVVDDAVAGMVAPVRMREDQGEIGAADLVDITRREEAG